MKLRRLAALVSAAVLVLGMVSAVSAHQNQTNWACGEPGKPACEEPSQEPSSEPSQEASQEPSTEPSQEASTEPSTEASIPECSNEQGQPTACDGEVEGLTGKPTLPPTDAISSNSTSGPDGTLPLVLIVLGVIGLAAVVITPVRARR